ncbi:hypothetical protein [Thermoleptolyngbya sp. M55_K2018_002]|uniref:hypothetical protein n=1 Tax=Thermoleptolyngbya sp. M55_K2018_002 TaxID=2747808 RepID=UPI0025E55EF2|nr:hypothetical protein [Thermoleptolyngbya sp. M55_K2018_002]
MLQSRQSDELRQSDARGAYAVDDLPSGAIPVGVASQIAPHSLQGTSDLETWAARSYRRLLAILGNSRRDRFANRQPTQPADHAHARMLLLALLCIPLYQQRKLLAVHWLSLKPDEFALDQLLTAANHQHGLAFPVAALPSLSLETNAALLALLRSLFLCAPYPVARLGQLYEQCLAWAPSPGQGAPRAAPKADGRKARGIYYTPEPLVNYCVSQTLGRLLSDPTQKLLGGPRVFDPAAGGGAFLLATYDALLRWVAGWSANSASVDGATVPPCTQRPPIAPIDCPDRLDRLDYPVDCPVDCPVDWHTRQQVLLDCIYGVDVDETAIALTRLSLQLKLLEGQPPPGFVLPDLTQNLVCADALLGLDWVTAFPSAAQAGGFVGQPALYRRCPDESGNPRLATCLHQALWLREGQLGLVLRIYRAIAGVVSSGWNDELGGAQQAAIGGVCCHSAIALSRELSACGAAGLCTGGGVSGGGLSAGVCGAAGKAGKARFGFSRTGLDSCKCASDPRASAPKSSAL